MARVVSRQSVLPLEPSHTLRGLGSSSTSGGYLCVDTSFSYGGSSSRIPPSVNWFGIPPTFVQIEHQLVCVTACRVALQSFRRCCHTLLDRCHLCSLHPLLHPANFLSTNQTASLQAPLTSQDVEVPVWECSRSFSPDSISGLMAPPRWVENISFRTRKRPSASIHCYVDAPRNFYQDD